MNNVSKKFWTARKIIYLSIALLIFVLYQIGKYSERKNKQQEARIAAAYDKINEEKKNRPLISEIKELEQKLSNLKSKPGSDSWDQELSKIRAALNLIKEVDSRGTEEEKKIANNSRKLLLDYQKKALPIIRKKFGDELDSKGWEYDLDVTVGGSANTSLTLIGAEFAANRNIKKMNEAIFETARNLKFKRINYKWIKHDDEYTYYDVKPSSDNDFID